MSSLPSICIAFLFVTAANCQAAWPSRGSPCCSLYGPFRNFLPDENASLLSSSCACGLYKRIILCPSRFTDRQSSVCTPLQQQQRRAMSRPKYDHLRFSRLVSDLCMYMYYTGCLPPFSSFFFVNKKCVQISFFFVLVYMYKLNCLHSGYLLRNMSCLTTLWAFVFARSIRIHK